MTRPDPMPEEEQQALLDAVTDDDAPWWLEEGDHDPRMTRRRRSTTWSRSSRSAVRSPRIRPARPRTRPGWAPPGRWARSPRRGEARASPDRRGVSRASTSSRAAQFATGMLMDTMPGRPELAGFAGAAAGDDDRYAGVSDDELAGVISALDRAEAQRVRPQARRGGRADPLAEKLHRDWRHISFARLLRTQALRTPGAAAARGSLATGRSRVGRACIAPLLDCQTANADCATGNGAGCLRSGLPGGLRPVYARHGRPAGNHSCKAAHGGICGTVLGRACWP